jgi:hypothetical protein
MAQVALGYPLTWCYLFLPGPWAEQIVVLVPFLLTPAFIYLYAREVGLSHFAALLAGLTFTYGGNTGSKLGGLGFMTHSELWLPLFLLALERARQHRGCGPLLLATVAYSMSTISGQAQGFLLVGIVGILYSLFLTLLLPWPKREESKSGWFWPRCRPLAVASGAMLLAIGVSAFQILETIPAAQRSVRSSLTYELFTAGSFTPMEALRSFLAPVHHYIEVSTYVAPISALFALYGCRQIFRRNRERRIVFWVAVALASFLLMLGGNTPLYHLLYHVPIFNLFRYPSRHAFEWSFALSMLAAYGADAVAVAVSHDQKPVAIRDQVIVWCLFCAGVILVACWWQAAFVRPLQTNFGLDSGLIPAQSEQSYLLWKFGFTFLMLLLVWYALKVSHKGGQITVVSICAIVLALFAEPQILFGHVWFPFAKTKDSFTTTPKLEQWLQQQQIEQQRVYTRVNLFARGYWMPPSMDLPNMTATRRLENVAGYEQLILERYSRALGDVGPDAVNKRYGMSGKPDESLFTDRSHVLDLLNTRYVVTFPHLATSPEQLIEKEGIGFTDTDLAQDLLPGETATLSAEHASGDTLALVTALSASVDVNQNMPVAHLRVIGSDGKVVEADLLAGRDTAEWAHERPDVSALVKHQLASVFDSRPGNAENNFSAYRYWSTVPLGNAIEVSKVEIRNTAKEARLALWKASLFDSALKHSATLVRDSGLPAAQWQPVRNQDGLVVWRNGRAMPRAWIVKQVETVDAEEALRRIRGTSPVDFDPNRTALVEVAPELVPRAVAAPIGAKDSVKVTNYRPDSITIEANASSPSFLVVSEMFYPGWEARVDGQLTKLFVTDYLLRGVALSSGEHLIEMKYTAPGAFKGMIISVGAVLILVALCIYSRRSHPATAS